MGKASSRKWQNRHTRRVLELIQNEFPGQTLEQIHEKLLLETQSFGKSPTYERVVVQAWHEVQARRAALSAWRQAGGGLRDLLHLDRLGVGDAFRPAVGP